MLAGEINCPKCTKNNVLKNGKDAKGEQRYLCKDTSCDVKSFKLEYTYNGWKDDISEKILNARRVGAGIRDIAKELGISKQKVQEILKEFQHKIDCLCKGCRR